MGYKRERDRQTGREGGEGKGEEGNGGERRGEVGSLSKDSWQYLAPQRDPSSQGQFGTYVIEQYCRLSVPRHSQYYLDSSHKCNSQEVWQSIQTQLDYPDNS